MTRAEQIQSASDTYLCGDKSYTVEYEEKAFIAGAEWADKNPQWISVDDQLPPEIEGEGISDYCFVAVFGGLRYDCLRYDYQKQQWVEHTEPRYGVTHWMEPVPQKKGGTK